MTKLTWCSRDVNLVEPSSLHEWLSIVIKRGVVIKNRSIVKCFCEETFGCLVEKAAPECKDDKVERIVISVTEKFMDVHEVLSDAPVMICRMFNCKHCCIYLVNHFCIFILFSTCQVSSRR